MRLRAHPSYCVATGMQKPLHERSVRPIAGEALGRAAEARVGGEELVVEHGLATGIANQQPLDPRPTVPGPPPPRTSPQSAHFLSNAF